jgi:hypothetical protein
MIDWGSGTMYLQDVVDVVPGKATKVFEGVKEKVVDQKLCFSIVTATRTLDLQAADEEERDLWVRGLRDLKAQLDEDLNRDAAAPGAGSAGGAEGGVTPRPDASGDDKTGAKAVYGVADTTPKEEAFEVQAARGVTFVKHGRNGKPHDKLIKVNLQTGEIR